MGFLGAYSWQSWFYHFTAIVERLRPAHREETGRGLYLKGISTSVKLPGVAASTAATTVST